MSRSIVEHDVIGVKPKRLYDVVFVCSVNRQFANTLLYGLGVTLSWQKLKRLIAKRFAIAGKSVEYVFRFQYSVPQT